MKKLTKLFLALSFALSITTSAFAVTVASWGGAYTESQKLGYGDPTAAKLGIEINWVDYSGGLSEIKAQKEAGAITWDIIDVFAFDTINGCEPEKRNVKNSKKTRNKVFSQPCRSGSQIFSKQGVDQRTE